MISKLRRRPAGTTRAGIAVDDNAAAVALVERHGAGVRLKHVAASPSADGDWAQRTTALTGDVDMKRVPITAVMDEQGYQLVLVECPQVPAGVEARWKRKLIAVSILQQPMMLL